MVDIDNKKQLLKLICELAKASEHYGYLRSVDEREANNYGIEKSLKISKQEIKILSDSIKKLIERL